MLNSVEVNILDDRLKQMMIGPVFRDLLRTCDKLVGDKFTKSARHRKFSDKPGTIATACRHFWGGKKT